MYMCMKTLRFRAVDGQLVAELMVDPSVASNLETVVVDELKRQLGTLYDCSSECEDE